MTTNFNNYLFRCSTLGNVVTASGKLTEGAKTYLSEVFINEVYGVRREAYGKALDKGIACEEDGFALLNKAIYPKQFVAKIKEVKQNKYIIGTPDTIMDWIVYDIKNAYDLFTFGKAQLTHLYEWQLKGYMMLHKLSRARLFYCINNMPEHILLDEERKMFYFQRKWVSTEDASYILACDELRAAHNYDAMPIEERFKIWDVELSDQDELKIASCVRAARLYLNELLNEHNDRIAFNKSLLEDTVVSVDKDVKLPTN